MLNKTSWVAVTVLFLLIAWATSPNEPVQLNNLPFAAYVNERNIVLVNESTARFDSLSLVLNGVFTRDTLTLEGSSEVVIPFSAFKDRNGTPFPAEEAPYLLEVFHNGNADNYTGGYMQTRFE